MIIFSIVVIVDWAQCGNASYNIICSEMCSSTVEYKLCYYILRGRIKGYNSSITAIMCQVASQVVTELWQGSYRMLEQLQNSSNIDTLLNQARAACGRMRLVSLNYFGLCIGMFACVCVCVCVSPPPRLLIASHMKGTHNNRILKFYGYSVSLYDTTIDKLNRRGHGS